jgi:hypothetical protein
LPCAAALAANELASQISAANWSNKLRERLHTLAL